jgi:hypothetical protein
MEWIQDREIKGEELQEEVTRQLALNELAKTAVANGALMAKVADMYSSVGNIPDDLPLIPVNKTKKTATAGEKRCLLDFPKAGMAVNT